MNEYLFLIMGAIREIKLSQTKTDNAWKATRKVLGWLDALCTFVAIPYEELPCWLCIFNWVKEEFCLLAPRYHDDFSLASFDSVRAGEVAGILKRLIAGQTTSIEERANVVSYLDDWRQKIGEMEGRKSLEQARSRF